MHHATDHQTVLLPEAVAALAIRPDGCYIDGTFGRGGHSGLIMQQLGPSGRLIAFDKDPAAIQAAQAQYPNEPRFSILHRRFADLLPALSSQNILQQVDGLLLDLGVSSPQLDQAERGFSFRHDGPLDMRMDASQGKTAAEWLAQIAEAELVQVLFQYGEERFARRIAGAIVREREQTPITRTLQLAQLIERAVPSREKRKHPATRTFQAIRIALNHELDELQQVLADALQVLAPGGRLAVISFHSLEDRIVKHFIRDQAQGPQLPKSVPVFGNQHQGSLKPIGKARKPSPDEILINPRARSAVLRVAEVT